MAAARGKKEVWNAKTRRTVGPRAIPAHERHGEYLRVFRSPFFVLFARLRVPNPSHYQPTPIYAIITLMLTLALRRRLVPLVIVVLVLSVLSACAAPIADRLAAPTPSVSDQLVQLAALASPTVQASPTVGAHSSPTAAPTAVKATRTPRPRAQAAATARPAATRTPSDGLPIIAQSDLPRQARDTIALIRQGGPFPYDKDGATFQNREGLLPKRASGYYREYTVITPGSRDRGARRIVTGKGGELYYTDDHYDSFQRVIP